MSELKLNIGEPFISPSWGSRLIIFSSATGEAVKEEDTKQYLSKVCKYASKFDVYVIPERFTILGTQSMCLVSPNGSVLTAQQQIFTEQETEINKSNLNLVKTDFGRVLLCVDTDIYRPDLARIAYNKGAELIVASQKIGFQDNLNHKIISGVWGAAQSNNLFAISVNNQASCVCAPRILTKNQEGFIVAPTSKSIIAKLSFSALKGLPERQFLPRSFYSKYRSELIRPISE